MMLLSSGDLRVLYFLRYWKLEAKAKGPEISFD